MKKTLTIAALALCSSLAFSNQLPEEWTSESRNGGTAYVVVPDSAGITESGKEWFAIVNYFKDGVYTDRSRVHVSGCPVRRGRMILVSVSTGEPLGEPLEWARTGDRVFDGVAMNVCKAAYVKDLFKLPGRGSAPEAPKARPGKDMI